MRQLVVRAVLWHISSEPLPAGFYAGGARGGAECTYTGAGGCTDQRRTGRHLDRMPTAPIACSRPWSFLHARLSVHPTACRGEDCSLSGPPLRPHAYPGQALPAGKAGAGELPNGAGMHPRSGSRQEVVELHLRMETLDAQREQAQAARECAQSGAAAEAANARVRGRLAAQPCIWSVRAPRPALSKSFW